MSSKDKKRDVLDCKNMKDVTKWSCDEVQRRLALYLSEELSSGEMTAVRSHLGRCSACRAALAREKSLSRALSEAFRPQVDPSYWEKTWPRVQVALVARRERRPRLKLLRRVLAGASAAAVAAAAAAGLLAFFFTQPPHVPMLARHDAAYFSKLPSTPPSASLTDKKDKASFELASLSMGHSSPTQRVMAWQNLEGL